MHAAPLTVIQQAWMVGLLAVWCGLLFGGFALGNPGPADARRMPLWTRLGSSAVLVVVGWSWLLITDRSGARSYAFLIALGITLGFIGDLAMAHVKPVRKHLLVGMSAFGLGHVAYTLAFVTIAASHPSWQPGRCASAWFIWLASAALGWWLVVHRSPRRTRLSWAALPYALLVACSAGAATCAAVHDPRFVPAAVGAALFLLSDTILAGVLFAELEFRFVRDLVWLTYGPAQMLIVTSVFAALQAAA